MKVASPSLFRIIEEACIHNLILSHTYYPSYARTLNLAGHERVLEFGCGGGLLSRSLARILLPDGSLTCIDISPYWIEKARHRLRKYPNTGFICGDVTSAGLQENHYDTIVIHFSLHKADGQDRIDVISALAGSLRPEGVLHIREPADRHHGMQLEDIRILMQDAGLRERSARCGTSLLGGSFCDGMFIRSW